jgi:hypothetical protein
VVAFAAEAIKSVFAIDVREKWATRDRFNAPRQRHPPRIACGNVQFFLTLLSRAYTLSFLPFPYQEAAMKNAAVGFRPHSGWTALVAVSLEKGEPVVLCRERVQLVETFSYKFRQPYHTAEKLPFERGREFISRVSLEARRLAHRALRGVQADLAKDGHRLIQCGLLLASGRPLPSLEKILASHALIHTADGELFREALSRASARCGVQMFRVREKELLEHAVQAFRLTEAALLRRVTEIGRPLGSPWSQDEKFAALAAWLALSEGAA